MVKVDDPWPSHGRVVWLTPEQGGRAKDPPPVTPDYSYAHTVYVPPHTVDSGLASFVLGNFEPGAWTSQADGRWLIVENAGDQLVEPGTLVVMTEGHRTVAYFHVESVDELPESTRPTA